MTVAVNLLPDVRQARLRQQHLRHLTTSLSVLIWIVAGGIVVLLLLATGAQKLQLQLLNNQIAQRTSEIQSIPNLNAALTAQNAIKALPGLYGQRTYYSVFLSTFGKVAPVGVTLSALATDANGMMTISGTAPNVAAVDKLYESLKAAGGTDNPTFSNIDLTSISKDSTGVASFNLTATVSPSATSKPTTDTSNTTGGGQ